MTYILAVTDLILKSPEGQVLGRGRELSFAVAPGEFWLIQGPNGAGKTTLMNTLMSERDVPGVSWFIAPAARDCLPQLDNIHFALPLTLADVIDAYNLREHQRMEEWARRLALDDLSKPWNGASGGERKKALLIRVLLKEPKLVFLDEPFNHLDPESRDLVARVLIEYIEENSHDTAVIIISHQNMGPLKTMQRCRQKTLELGT